MRKNPTFKLLEAHAVSAAKAIEINRLKYGYSENSGDALWECMEYNPHFDPSSLTTASGGLKIFIDTRRAVEELIERVDPQG